MTTDYRALCKELTNELHGYASANPHHDSDELVVRARLALAAEPEPEGPADDDIEALHQAVFASRLYGSPPSTTFEVDFARAALARWGHAPNA